MILNFKGIDHIDAQLILKQKMNQKLLKTPRTTILATKLIIKILYFIIHQDFQEKLICKQMMGLLGKEEGGKKYLKLKTLSIKPIQIERLCPQHF